MSSRDIDPKAEGAGQEPKGSHGRSRDPMAGPEVDTMFRRAADVIASGRPMPLSSSVMVNRDEVLDLLGEAIERLPDELRQARWLLKEREDFLERVQGEGDAILATASSKAESMVQRTEVVKSAELRAKRLVTEAEDEARRVRHECEDFCDQRLAQFEIVLNRTLRMVHAGREKLSSAPLAAPASERDDARDEPRPMVTPGGDAQAPAGADPPGDAGPGFFDQDLG